MTKRDYFLIARAIAPLTNTGTPRTEEQQTMLVSALIDALCTAFSADNPRFQAELFISAVDAEANGLLIDGKES